MRLSSVVGRWWLRNGLAGQIIYRKLGISSVDALVRICAGCALKAREVRYPEMETAAKPSSQPRTKSCVMSGNGHCEA